MIESRKSETVADLATDPDLDGSLPIIVAGDLMPPRTAPYFVRSRIWSAGSLGRTRQPSQELLTIELCGRDGETARRHSRLPYSAREGPVAEVLGAGVGDQVVVLVR